MQTSGNVQNDGTLRPRGNKKSRRHSVHAAEDVDGHLSPKTPMQLRTQPKQSTTTDVRDEKSAEDDDEEDDTFTAETIAAKQSARERIGKY